MTDFDTFSIDPSVSQIYAARIRANVRYGSPGGDFGIKTFVRGIEVENTTRSAPFSDENCAWTDEVFLSNFFVDWAADPGAINDIEVRVYRSGNSTGLFVHGVELVSFYENYADAVIRPVAEPFAAGGSSECDPDDSTLIVRNSSGWITLPLAATISGSGAGAFSILSGATQEIGPGDTGSIEVRFDPSLPGSYSATLNLGNSMGSVTLTGTAWDAEISDTALSFGPTQVGNVSPDQAVIVRNSSTSENKDYSVSVAPGAPFSITSGGGNFTLPPLASRTVSVRFEPSTVGLARADVFLGIGLTTAPCGNGTASYVQLLGAGTPAVPCLTSVPAMVFGEVATNTTLDLSITITNESSGTVDLSNASIFPPFSFAPGQVLVLDPFGTLTVDVRFAPDFEDTYFQPLDLGCGDPVWLDGWGGPATPDPWTWVDFSHTGPETGSSSSPYNSLLEGVTFVEPGGTVAIRSGATADSIAITKELILQAVDGPVTIGK